MYDRMIYHTVCTASLQGATTAATLSGFKSWHRKVTFLSWNGSKKASNARNWTKGHMLQIATVMIYKKCIYIYIIYIYTYIFFIIIYSLKIYIYIYMSFTFAMKQLKCGRNHWPRCRTLTATVYWARSIHSAPRTPVQDHAPSRSFLRNLMKLWNVIKIHTCIIDYIYRLLQHIVHKISFVTKWCKTLTIWSPD